MSETELTGNRIGYAMDGGTSSYLEIFGGDDELVARFEELVKNKDTVGIELFFKGLIRIESDKETQFRKQNDFLNLLKELNTKLGKDHRIDQSVKAFVGRVKKFVSALLINGSHDVRGNHSNLTNAIEKARLNIN